MTLRCRLLDDDHKRYNEQTDRKEFQISCIFAHHQRALNRKKSICFNNRQNVLLSGILKV